MLKHLITVTSNQEANEIQDSIIKQLKWNYVSLVSYNLPLLATISVADNIMLPLCYSERIRKKEAEALVKDLLEKFDLSFIMYYRPKKLNEFEILIVKYLRAIMRHPTHVVFIMPDKMISSEDYTIFQEFVSSINNFEVTVVEFVRYIDEYLGTNFIETRYKSWLTRVLETSN